HLEAPELLDGACHRYPHLGVVSDVGVEGDGPATVSGDLVCRLLGRTDHHVHYRDRATLRGEALCGSPTNPRPRPGDQGDPSFQLSGHRILLSSSGSYSAVQPPSITNAAPVM